MTRNVSDPVIVARLPLPPHSNTGWWGQPSASCLGAGWRRRNVDFVNTESETHTLTLSLTTDGDSEKGHTMHRGAIRSHTSMEACARGRGGATARASSPGQRAVLSHHAGLKWRLRSPSAFTICSEPSFKGSHVSVLFCRPKQFLFCSVDF